MEVEEIIVAPESSEVSVATRVREAFMRVSQGLTGMPEAALQRLVSETMGLTGADSAGVSLEGHDNGDEVFRWIATSGEFSRYLNGTMPRHFSPCGTTLEKGKTLVMRDPVRFYPYISKLHVPVSCALLVPYRREGKLVGTLWAIKHTPQSSFTEADVKIVEELTTFAAVILDVAARVPTLRRPG